MEEKKQDIQGKAKIKEHIPEKYRDSPICERTGRLLTEWYEAPHFTDEDIKQMALDAGGLKEPIHKPMFEMEDEELLRMREYHRVLMSHSKRKYKGGMSRQEVQARMNEASKMVDLTKNPKFLDKDTQDRTGIESNPLWKIEVLARSGTLSPKEQLAAWAKLAEYTHSKAATITHNTETHTLDDYIKKKLETDREAIEAEYTVVQLEERNTAKRGLSRNFFKQQALKAKAREAQSMDEASDTANELTAEQIEYMSEELQDFDLKDFYDNGETEDNSD